MYAISFFKTLSMDEKKKFTKEGYYEMRVL